MSGRNIKRSITFTPETLKALEVMAIQNCTTTSELVRRFVEEGLAIKGHRQDIDFIASIIRQEFASVYHIEDIKAVVEQQTNRIAKMLMKSGKISAGGFFLLVRVLLLMANEGSEDAFDEMMSDAIAMGVDYMQKKDVQVNSFLQDTDYLRKQSERL